MTAVAADMIGATSQAEATMKTAFTQCPQRMMSGLRRQNVKDCPKRGLLRGLSGPKQALNRQCGTRFSVKDGTSTENIVA